MFVVTGAYGRKYKTPESVKKDWDDNKDFYIVRGSQFSYMNKADWDKYNKGWDSVHFMDGTIRMVLATGLL